MAELYKYGARIKNPKDYESIYCTTCNKLIGWSPYFDGSNYVIYCKKCGEGVMTLLPSQQQGKRS